MTIKSQGIGSHHSARARTDTWLTPPHILDRLGEFDLDPCASVDQPWKTAASMITIHDNGLNHGWHGRVWLNPPYTSTVIGTWLRRMAEHGHGTALIFARTETQAFFDSVWEQCDALLFLRGRLNFHLPDGRRANKNAGAPSVLCAYGTDDADCLAGCGIDGAFVPLRLRSMIFGFEGTWAQQIMDWMTKTDTIVHLSDLYRAFAASPKAKRNPNYQAKIRQQLQAGPYKSLGNGTWRLL